MGCPIIMSSKSVGRLTARENEEMVLHSTETGINSNFQTGITRSSFDKDGSERVYIYAYLLWDEIIVNEYAPMR